MDMAGDRWKTVTSSSTLSSCSSRERPLALVHLPSRNGATTAHRIPAWSHRARGLSFKESRTRQAPAHRRTEHRPRQWGDKRLWCQNIIARRPAGRRRTGDACASTLIRRVVADARRGLRLSERAAAHASDHGPDFQPSPDIKTSRLRTDSSVAHRNGSKWVK